MEAMDGQLQDAAALIALSVAMGHPAFSSNSQLLCAAASTCRAWRETVQQHSTCSLAAVLRYRAPQRLFSFAAWLPKHAGLVNSISVQVGPGEWPVWSFREQAWLPVSSAGDGPNNTLIASKFAGEYVELLEEFEYLAQDYKVQLAGMLQQLMHPDSTAAAAAVAAAAAARLQAGRAVAALEAWKQAVLAQRHIAAAAAAAAEARAAARPAALDLLLTAFAAAAQWVLAAVGIHKPAQSDPVVGEQRQQQQQQQHQHEQHAAEQQQQQHQQNSADQQQLLKLPLRLASFSSDLPWSAGMLAALPAHSLTQLDMNFYNSPDFGDASFSAALGQLTNLRQLRLSWAMPDDGMRYDSLLSVSQLTQLTLLSVAAHQRGIDTLAGRLSDLQLRQLHVRLIQPGSVEESMARHGMPYLTQLEDVETYWVPPRGCTLPATLQQLKISQADMGALSAMLAPLEQLTSLSLLVPGYGVPHAQLDELQQPWTQLRELSVVFNNATEQQLRRATLAAVAACSNLTKLHLDVRGWPSSQPEAVCPRLAGLRSLKHLSIRGQWCSERAAGDALALTVLTRLTRLDLLLGEAAVGTQAATALARSMLQLQCLNLTRCGVDLSNEACLAAIVQLTQLTELMLGGNSGLTEQGLMQLEGLPMLRLMSW